MTPQDTPPPLDADEAAERALVEAIRKIAYPERIFLQLDANEIEDTSEGPVMAGDITWCKDEINNDDVEYVRVDSLPGVDQGSGVREAPRPVRLRAEVWAKDFKVIVEHELGDFLVVSQDIHGSDARNSMIEIAYRIEHPMFQAEAKQSKPPTPNPKAKDEKQ